MRHKAKPYLLLILVLILVLMPYVFIKVLRNNICGNTIDQFGGGMLASPEPFLIDQCKMDGAQREMDECANKLFDESLENLEKILGGVRFNYDNDSSIVPLDESIDNYLQYVDNYCQFENFDYSGGSAHGMMYILCKARLINEFSDKLMEHYIDPESVSKD